MNQGLFNNIEMLKSKASEILEEEEVKETREERRARKKAQGEFDLDSDEEWELEERKKKKHGDTNYYNEFGDETKGGKQLKQLLF